MRKAASQGIIRGIASWLTVGALSGVCLVWGFAPDEWFAALLTKPPSWVLSIWTRIGAVILGALLGWWTYKVFQSWQWRRRQSLRETDDIAEPYEQADPRYDTPIHQAVDYVAIRVDDCDSGKCYPQARHVLRVAAKDGRITMYGKKCLRGKQPSKLRTAIPTDYWDDQELNERTTSDHYTHHEHTRPEIGDGFEKIGQDREQYWDVRVSMNEVKKEWA